MNLADRIWRALDGTRSSFTPSGLHGALEPRADLPFTPGRTGNPGDAWAAELAEQDTLTYGEIRP